MSIKSKDWVSVLKEIKRCPSKISIRKDRVSIGPNTSLMLDGEEIPYEHLSLAFDCLSYRTKRQFEDDGSRKTTNFLDVDDAHFTYIKFDNGDFEIRVNNKLHCSSGAARKCGATTEYYKHGLLHNEIGPAVVVGYKNKFYLDGKELTQAELLECSPKSTHSWGIIGDKSFTIAKLGDHAIVRGVDGTAALLTKSDNSPNIDDLVLDLIGTRIAGYKVEKYLNVGNKIGPLYDYLVSENGTWKMEYEREQIKASCLHTDGTEIKLSLAIRTRHLSLKIKLPDEHIYSVVTNFTFNDISAQTSAFLQFPTIEVHRSDGLLHNTMGPAIILPAATRNSTQYEGYFINGKKTDLTSQRKYNNSLLELITDTNSSTQSRHDIDDIEGSHLQNILDHVNENNNSTLSSFGGDKLINSTEAMMTTYTDTNVSNEQRQSKFEEALKRVARKNADANKINLIGDTMETKTIKYGDTTASSKDSRVRQVTSGAKLGVQKAALRTVSQKAAEKIVDIASPTDNIVVQRIVQLALLLGTAELSERLPDGAASKIGLTEDRREGYGGLARYVAGETLGRDAVDIMNYIAPLLLDKLQDISAEEIAELTVDSEEYDSLKIPTFSK
jgi:hypothetical protein